MTAIPLPRSAATGDSNRDRSAGAASDRGRRTDLWTLSLLAAAVLATTGPAEAQQVTVGNLTSLDRDVPTRLQGYGLVVGLDGTGDRTISGYAGGHTARSVANLLRRFDVTVPENVLRTRNVAAVLVTAQLSSYQRPGSEFEVKVASVGDAVSLKGGVLWTTPLVARAGGDPVATAQGPVVISEGVTRAGEYPVETSARIPDGGLLRKRLSGPALSSVAELTLRRPSLGTATRIADAINQEFGEGVASVSDPGGVQLSVPDGIDQSRAAFLARVQELQVTPDRAARIVIDGRDGTVAAGGGLSVSEAVVSHAGMTLTIGPGANETGAEAGGEGAEGEGQAGAGSSTSGVPGSVRVPSGATVQDIAAALHAVAASPSSIASIFESLQEVGAISAEVTVR